jgi:NAD-dependent deacetylase
MINDSLHAAIDLLRRADYVVALTGAGISTHSGIPDFRSPQSGLWEHHNPAEVASISGFRRNPHGFYEWIRPLAHLIMKAQPNMAHRALVQIERAGRLRSVVTQNIDMLHTQAGSQTVFEVHGHLREATCIHCFEVFPARPLIHEFLTANIVPLCPECGHVLKPNVILFGEQLPAQALVAARREAQRCDLMLVVGTSLEVFPAAQLPLLARQNGARLIIVNLTPTPIDPMADAVFHADAVDILPKLADALESD